MSSEIKNIESEILNHFKDDCSFIYTFGSLADEKRFNAESDIDFALYLKNLPKNFDKYDYMSKFSIQQNKDVDLIILNQSDIIITMQVLENGKLIYCNEPAKLTNFKAQKRSEYIDFKQHRLPLEKKLIEG